MAITNGYCTLAAVKTSLGLEVTTHDAALEDLVEDVSREIDEHCSTWFYARTETRHLTASRAGVLLLDAHLLSVTSIETDENADGTYEVTWASTDYRLAPYNAQQGSQPRPYWKLEVHPDGDYTFPVGVPKGVKIVGSWGFSSTTPRPVKRACLFEVARKYRAQDAPLGTAGGGEFQQSIVGPDLHPFTIRLLERFREVAIA